MIRSTCFRDYSAESLKMAMRGASINPARTYAKLKVSKKLNDSFVPSRRSLLSCERTWEGRTFLGSGAGIICNSGDFYIRADSKTRRRPISRNARASGACLLPSSHRQQSTNAGVPTRRIAKGTSYSHEEKRRRRCRFSCPLGKSNTKSIHVYLRIGDVARCLAEHVASKGRQNSPDLFTAVRLAVSLHKKILIRLRYDVSDVYIHLYSLYLFPCFQKYRS